MVLLQSDKSTNTDIDATRFTFHYGVTSMISHSIHIIYTYIYIPLWCYFNIKVLDLGNGEKYLHSTMVLLQFSPVFGLTNPPHIFTFHYGVTSIIPPRLLNLFAM